MTDFDNLDDFYKSLENADTLNEIMIGQEVEVQCPKCEKEFDVIINKDNNYRCSKCGHGFSIDFNLE
ncbi:hypothetical protein FDG50_00440 [Clostridium botulinum]|uniref:CpXC domain-containing protein n=1 Tax=Clostridium botulinum TaxID=1491 RepID=UPI0013FE82C8|nr:CpXC domain-containing protein [Clostridium botulinum]MBY6835997.1 hypothetical protein [Clostridium botulinum]NFG65780.1 hypothetical protein [Clostridium botulinum]NFQ22616.1 hypothetical protein [Clostridium botulinum]